MANLKLVDGCGEDNHIFSDQIAKANRAIVGEGDYVFKTGSQMEAIIESNNKINLSGGYSSHCGYRMYQQEGTFDSVIIENGTQGKFRNDIIVQEYTRDVKTNIETAKWAVIKGVPMDTEGVDPELITEDLEAGGHIYQGKMYRVRLDGLNIIALEPLFEISPTIKELADKYTELNSKLEWKPFAISVSGQSNVLIIQKCVANAIEADIYIYYRRINWTIPNDTWEIIAGIPDGYRPTIDCPCMIYDNMSNYIGFGVANPSGVIRFKMMNGPYSVNGESTFRFHYTI